MADLIVTIVQDAGTELFVDPVTGFVGLPDEFAAAAATPFNRLPIPVTGQNFSPLRQVQLNDDGPDGGVRFSQRTGSSRPDAAAGSYYCDDESVLLDDGICYALLQQGPCLDRLQWLTLDPISLRVYKLHQLYTLLDGLNINCLCCRVSVVDDFVEGVGCLWDERVFVTTTMTQWANVAEDGNCFTLPTAIRSAIVHRVTFLIRVHETTAWLFSREALVVTD